MDHRRFHLLEKIQVQLAAVAALMVVYFLVWPVLRPSDPRSSWSFIAGGDYLDGALFAVILWAMTAACAAVTVGSRPEGALVAALVGAAGISARCPQIRTLMWQQGDGLPDLYGRLAIELVILCAILLVAACVVDVVRQAIGRLKPRWLWRSAALDFPHGGQAGDEHHDTGAPAGRGLLLYILNPAKGKERSSAKDGGGRRAALKQSACCLGLGLTIGVVLVLLLMQSPQRGQILFALVAAFLIAFLIAHQEFPTPHSIVAWLSPIVVGLGSYAIGAFSAHQGSGAWIKQLEYTQALPIDWLTGGCGGALIGYWISERLHDMKHIERAESQRSP